jgi:excisionase family DNA binding protein
MDAENDCKTLTVDEAAKILGVSRVTAYEGVRSGDIPAIRIRKRWVISRASLDKMLEAK